MEHYPLFPLKPNPIFRRLGTRKRKAESFKKSPLISESEVVDILKPFHLHFQGFSKDVINPSRSKVQIVKTDKGKKVIKQYKDTMGQERVIHSHSILKYLQQVDFPAPRLLIDEKGRSMIDNRGKTVAVFDYIDGYHQYHKYLMLPARSDRYIYFSGMALGSLHQTLRNFKPKGFNENGINSETGERWLKASEYVKTIKKCREELDQLHSNEESALRSMILQYGDWIASRIISLDDSLNKADLQSLIIHGDFGPYNLFFKYNQPVMVMDFEHARYDWGMVDIVKSIYYISMNRFGINNRKIQSFLNGYQQECKIQASELRLLPKVWEFITLRRIVYCWAEYLQTRSRKYYAEALNKIALVKWINDNEILLSKLHYSLNLKFTNYFLLEKVKN